MFPVLKYPGMTPLARDLLCCMTNKLQESLVFQSVGAIVVVV